MTTIQFIDLAVAYAPSINEFVRTLCLAIVLLLLKRYGIIKPTRR